MKIEVYAAANEIEGQRIVSFLQAEGIEATLEIKQPITQIPFGSSFSISVPGDLRQRAIELIANARLDEIISDTGSFL